MPQLTAQERESQIAQTQQYLQSGGFERLGSVRIGGQGMVDIYQNANWEIAAVRQSDGFRFQSNARINEFYQRFQDQQEGQSPFQAEARREESRNVFDTVAAIATAAAAYAAQAAAETYSRTGSAARERGSASENAAQLYGQQAQQESSLSREEISRRNMATEMQAVAVLRDSGILPAGTYEQMQQNPATVSTRDLAHGYDGYYVMRGGGASITIDPDLRGETARLHTMAHEELHHASRLSRGSDVPSEYKFLDEGMTELYAVRALQASGIQVPQSEVTYQSNIRIVAAIEQIAGRDAVRDAYFTGNFDSLRAPVDRELGSGTFQQMVSVGGQMRLTPEGVAAPSPAEAFSYLERQVTIAMASSAGGGVA